MSDSRTNVNPSSSSSLVLKSLSANKTETDEQPDKYLLAPEAIARDKKIGYGYFGSVYKATWSGMTVAAKYVDLKFKKTLAKEKGMMLLLTQLNAPYCVNLYGYTITSVKYVLVMEYMPKGSLDDLIDNKEFHYDLNFCVNVTRRIATAIAFLHEIEIVHRDIKPGNILLDQNYSAKLGDFGWARHIDKKVGGVGTWPYMAPEILDTPYSVKADVFSLGVTLWEMVARKEPYEKLQTTTDIYKHVYAGNREPIPEKCPPLLAGLITRSWHNNPEVRPTAREFLDELNKSSPMQVENNHKLMTM